MTTTASEASPLPGELRRLAAAADPIDRRIAEAVRRCVTGELDPGERGWVDAVEALRTHVDRSPEVVQVALPNRRGIEKTAVLGELCRLRSKKGVWALALLTLVRELQPTTVLELGTGVGISGAYLAAGLRLNNRGALTTIEGAPALVEKAREHLDVLGLDDVTVVQGRFADALPAVLETLGPVDLAFVDGHHDEHATQTYFAQLLPCMAPDGVVVFDDIAWSEGMQRAWQALRRHPAVGVAVDLGWIGVCALGARAAQQVDLPHLSRMAAALRSTPPGRHAAPEPPGPPLDLDAFPVRRMNWGSGPHGLPGWINSDIKTGRNIQLPCDILQGLPLPDGCLDYVVSHHALPEIPLPDQVPVLRELRRVLRPGGTLRLSLPDLERNLAAWQVGDPAWFLVPDEEAATVSGKMITQLLWYGYVRTLFTAEFVEELLRRAGFPAVRHCAYQVTATGAADITALDGREAESLFVEAVA